ncbi:MAG: hypothetical protein ABI594_15790 [Ginsengibacter sp.]
MIKIAPDKWKHFFVGIVMGATLQAFAWYLFPTHFIAGIIASSIIVIAISYGFEIFSLITKRGHYEILDAIAAIIGGAIGIAIILLVLFISGHRELFA